MPDNPNQSIWERFGKKSDLTLNSIDWMPPSDPESKSQDEDVCDLVEMFFDSYGTSHLYSIHNLGFEREILLIFGLNLVLTAMKYDKLPG